MRIMTWKGYYLLDEKVKCPTHSLGIVLYIIILYLYKLFLSI